MRNSLKLFTFTVLCVVGATAYAHRLGTASFIQPIKEVNIGQPNEYQIASSYDVSPAQGVDSSSGILTLAGVSGSSKAFKFTIPYSKIAYRKSSSDDSTPQSFEQMCPAGDTPHVYVTPIALTSNIDRYFTKKFMFYKVTFEDNCSLGSFGVSSKINDDPDHHAVQIILYAYNKEVNLNPAYNNKSSLYSNYLNKHNYCEDTAKKLGNLNMKIQFTIQCQKAN